MLKNCNDVINFAATDIRGKHYVIQDIKVQNLVCDGDDMYFIDVDRNNIFVLEDGMPNWSSYVYLRQTYPDEFNREDIYNYGRISMTRKSGEMQLLFELLVVSAILAKNEYTLSQHSTFREQSPTFYIFDERVLIVPNAIIDVVASEASPEKKKDFLSYFKEQDGFLFIMYILMGYKYNNKGKFIRERVSWHLEKNILKESGCVCVSQMLFSVIYDVVKQKRNENRLKNREAKKAMNESMGSAAKRQRREFLERMFKSK
tara:strand:- start:4 stop:780 length:777 start_codon:yes stop_codon:yes gene_type:complete